MLLSDDLLLNYKRCSRLTFLKVYGNRQEQDQEKDFLLKLRQESSNHVRSILAQCYPFYHQPLSSRENWQRASQETLALMQKGVDYIYRGILQVQAFSLNGEDSLPFVPTELYLIGRPHLLVKNPGKSYFGDWYYTPVNIQLARRPKSEYKIVVAFYAYLLTLLQGVTPSSGELILRKGNTHRVNLALWLPRMQETLAECGQMLFQQQEPDVFISRQRCSLCNWYSHCYAIAQSQQHLSLVPGVTPNRYQYLQSLGVESLSSLATACPINLGELMGVDVATQLKQQALSILEDRPIRKSTEGINFPNTAIELYFDIEAEPERNLDYLLGVLLVDHRNNTETFYPFLAENSEQEETIWQEFINFVSNYTEAPIFHYSPYEVETIKRLGRLYYTPETQIESILARCIDLHHSVISCVTFPVESYSLKSLANWLGFQWRDTGISGEQSVYWYDQWLTGGDRSLLQAILRYNEDDCRATYHLKNWLADFFASEQNIPH